jgi:hypothetical protein
VVVEGEDRYHYQTLMDYRKRGQGATA